MEQHYVCEYRYSGFERWMTSAQENRAAPKDRSTSFPTIVEGVGDFT